MKKRMLIMLGVLGLILIIVFGYQIVKGMFLKKYVASLGSIPISVSTIKASHQDWASILKATGSVRAIQGLNVTPEVAGLIRAIYFKPGQEVKAGDMLVQLNIDDELAALNAQQATAELAKITFDRDKAQFAVNAVSKEVVDTDEANLKNQLALVQQQVALIDKKTIRAPFDGKLGISQIYLGQYLNPGDPIVTLQALDPIYVDFFIPEQQLMNVEVGQSVNITTDSYPDRNFHGYHYYH